MWTQNDFLELHVKDKSVHIHIDVTILSCIIKYSRTCQQNSRQKLLVKFEDFLRKPILTFHCQGHFKKTAISQELFKASANHAKHFFDPLPPEANCIISQIGK